MRSPAFTLPKDLWRKRPKLSQAIRSRHNDHDRHAGGLNVLLKFNVLINGEKSLEPLRQDELQQFAIALRRPTHFNDRVYVVPGEVVPERPRDALIE